eukprot:COSAG02_NODE_5134_length_4600_cov_5.775383_2_plen_55_part_00
MAPPRLVAHRRMVATTRVDMANHRRNNGRVAVATGATKVGAMDRLLPPQTVVTG